MLENVNEQNTVKSVWCVCENATLMQITIKLLISKWMNFSQFNQLLTMGKLYRSCAHSCTLHGSETWPLKKEHVDTSAGW